MDWKFATGGYIGEDSQRKRYFFDLARYYEANPDKIPHGTRDGYTVGGCRCPDCAEAMSVSQEEWKKKTLAEMEDNPGHQLHGTISGYSAGCRCKPCTRAETQYQKEYRKNLLTELDLDPEHKFHGTTLGFNAGCRCKLCVTNQKNYRKQLHERIVTEMQDNPDDPRHGTRTGYQAGCRCRPCTDRNAEASRERQLRKRQEPIVNSMQAWQGHMGSIEQKYAKPKRIWNLSMQWDPPIGRPRPHYIPTKKFHGPTGGGSFSDQPHAVGYIMHPDTGINSMMHEKCIRENRCIWCGDKFKPGEMAQRLVPGPSRPGEVLPSDFGANNAGPAHPSCLSELMVFCHGLPNRSELKTQTHSELFPRWMGTNVEEGTIEQLRENYSKMNAHSLHDKYLQESMKPWQGHMGSVNWNQRYATSYESELDPISHHIQAAKTDHAASTMGLPVVAVITHKEKHPTCPLCRNEDW